MQGNARDFLDFLIICTCFNTSNSTFYVEFSTYLSVKRLLRGIDLYATLMKERKKTYKINDVVTRLNMMKACV